MNTSGSVFDNWVGTRARILGGLLCLAPLALPVLATGCSTSVSASATTGTCTAATIATCSDTGYTCTGTAEPAVSGMLCSGDGSGNFCCVATTGTVTGSCTNVLSDVCTNGGGTAYRCDGAARPEQTYTGIICNTNGAGDYCCVTSSTCSFDANVSGCVSGSYGYSCAVGDAPPDAADPTLVCSEPTTQNGQDEYCCYTNTTTAPATATCQQDASVTGCAADSYGFSCTGTDHPEVDFSGITCSTTGTPGTDLNGNAATLFCCTYSS